MEHLEENLETVSTFKWHIGRLEDLHMTSLRTFSFYPISFDFGKSNTKFRVAFLIVMIFLVSFGTSFWLGLILLLLPFYVLFCAGVVQHILFKDQVNKKFDSGWRSSANLIENILKQKEIPYTRKNQSRKIMIKLDHNDIEIMITPCQSFKHPRTQQVRWVATTQGIVSDIALRPLTNDTFPLIEKLTLEIDAEIEKAKQASLAQETSN